jgi:hypothetical protein
MRRYAQNTSVPVDKSKREIESILIRYGAQAFTSGWNETSAMLAFRIKNLNVRFVLPYPNRDDKEFTHKEVRGRLQQRDPRQIDKVYYQELCRRWRALHLVVKAKLEAVESKISTIECEFLAFVVLPNDQTAGEWFGERALPMLQAGKDPFSLPEHKDEE